MKTYLDAHQPFASAVSRSQLRQTSEEASKLFVETLVSAPLSIALHVTGHFMARLLGQEYTECEEGEIYRPSKKDSTIVKFTSFQYAPTTSKLFPLAWTTLEYTDRTKLFMYAHYGLLMVSKAIALTIATVLLAPFYLLHKMIFSVPKAIERIRISRSLNHMVKGADTKQVLAESFSYLLSNNTNESIIKLYQQAHKAAGRVVFGDEARERRSRNIKRAAGYLGQLYARNINRCSTQSKENKRIAGFTSEFEMLLDGADSAPFTDEYKDREAKLLNFQKSSTFDIPESFYVDFVIPAMHRKLGFYGCVQAMQAAVIRNPHCVGNVIACLEKCEALELKRLRKLKPTKQQRATLKKDNPDAWSRKLRRLFREKARITFEERYAKARIRIQKLAVGLHDVKLLEDVSQRSKALSKIKESTGFFSGFCFANDGSLKSKRKRDPNVTYGLIELDEVETLKNKTIHELETSVRLDR